jgi:hypothetical protein
LLPGGVMYRLPEVGTWKYCSALCTTSRTGFQKVCVPGACAKVQSERVTVFNNHTKPPLYHHERNTTNITHATDATHAAYAAYAAHARVER